MVWALVGMGAFRRKPWARRRTFSMMRLTASVPPLLIRWVSNGARTWSFHVLRVRPSWAISGDGTVEEGGDDLLSNGAALLAGSSWYMERTCW
jgi:hypothetical protein